MAEPADLPAPVAPIFVFADDDREALEQLLAMLAADWFYIPVTRMNEVVKYAKEFATRAIFLSEPIDYPRGGAARLLQELLDQVGKPVVILTEHWDPGVARKWKAIGASDCLPHPTRTDQRLKVLRKKIEEFALRTLSESPR
jgi:FixJ family two-component response regulator